MNALFENTYTRNEEFAKEIYSYWFLRRPFVIVADVLMALYLIGGVISFKWLFVLVPIFWGFFQIFMYNRNVKIAINRDKEVAPAPIELTVFVTDDEIFQKSSTGNEAHIKYTDIKNVFTTKNYICAVTKAMQLVSFKKDGFAKGDEIALKLFLQNKGIKVK